MTLTKDSYETELQDALPRKIVRQDLTFTVTLITGAPAIRLEKPDRHRKYPQGTVFVAPGPDAADPERSFGYALNFTGNHYRPQEAVQSGLTIGQAVAECCDAMIQMQEEQEKDAELRRQARNRMYEWLIQAPLAQGSFLP